MKHVSQITAATVAFFVCFSVCIANSDQTIFLPLGERNSDNSSGEISNNEFLKFRVGTPLNVSVINEHEFSVFLPAAPSACAIVALEHRTNDTWQKWSDCDFRRRISNPVFLTPGQALDGTRKFRTSKAISNVAVGENSHYPKSSVPAKELNESQNSIDRSLVQIEVQQSEIATMPVPFFERFNTLPAGEYQLVVSYAFSDQPDEIRYARSSAFSVVDQDVDQK